MRGEVCSRHPDRTAECGVVTHYIFESRSWRDVVRTDQVMDGLCGECRIELIRWLGTPALVTP